MDRRGFLATVGLVVSAGAGCLGRSESGWEAHRGPTVVSEGVPDEMVVRTEYWQTEILVDGLWEGTSRTIGAQPPRGGYTLLANPDDAADRFRSDAVDAATVIADTDFDTAYVMVVQYTMPTGKWLELETLARETQQLEVRIDRRTPDPPPTDDVSAHSLAIEITDENTEIPATIHVEIDGNTITHEF